MRHRGIVMALLILMAWSASSGVVCEAAKDDGNTLLTDCTTALRYAENGYRSTEAGESSAYSYCMGYVRGAVDGLSFS